MLTIYLSFEPSLVQSLRGALRLNYRVGFSVAGKDLL